MAYINGHKILFSAHVNGVDPSDADAIASNVLSGKTFYAGDGTKKTGTYATQEKSAAPATAAQEITPDEGYNAMTKVNIAAVDSTIDSNITADNIKKDISILGVTGTFEGGGGGGTYELITGEVTGSAYPAPLVISGLPKKPTIINLQMKHFTPVLRSNVVEWTTIVNQASFRDQPYEGLFWYYDGDKNLRTNGGVENMNYSNGTLTFTPMNTTFNYNTTYCYNIMC